MKLDINTINYSGLPYFEMQLLKAIMKLDITKTNIKYNNYSGLPVEIQFLKEIKEGHSFLRLLNPLTH